MTTGSGPAGEVTMDDIRARLQSITARFTAMRERVSDAVLNAGSDGEPGQFPSGGGQGG